MNRFAAALIFSVALLYSCSEDKDDNISNVNITLNFNHAWDQTPVTVADFNDIKFVNSNGDVLSIERLRYLISNVTFHKTDGSSFSLKTYDLVDLSKPESLAFNPATTIPSGEYSNVTFTFGFTNEDNSENYEDLNSASWSVPSTLGGGYHYMQLDGKFLNNMNNAQGFNYHAIRAADNPGMSPTFPQDTFFNVSLGATNISKNSIFNIEMNIAEWFKNPNTWDLNVLNQMLMPNSTAQIMMFENGQNVFKLTSISH